MDEVQLATLYVVTEGAYLHRDGQAILIDVEKVTTGRIPLHMIDSIACFGRVMVSPSLLEYCAEQQIAVNFMNSHGRLMARLDAPASGNVQLRRKQFRLADDPVFCVAVARCFVAGKIQNARPLLSGHNSNKSSWLRFMRFSFCGNSFENSSFTGLFCKIVTLRICRISLGSWGN